MLNLLISCCLYFGFPTSLSLYEMSSDKKMMAPTYSSQKRKHHLSAERASKIKLRRHDLYVQLSIDKKKMFLSRWRVKNVDSASCCLLVECTKEASCFGVGVDLPRQQALAIRESSSAAKKGKWQHPVDLNLNKVSRKLHMGHWKIPHKE